MFAWSERQLCALRPMAKGGHTVQALRLEEHGPDHTIVVFGGSDAYGVSYNDVLAIEPLVESDVTSWRCTELQPTNSGNVSQRMGHSSVKAATSLLLAGGQSCGDWSAESMVVFGGYQAVPDTKMFSDVYMIAVHRSWSKVIGTWNAPPLLRVEQLVFTGAGPCARHSHASVLNTDGTSMFVMGGASSADGSAGGGSGVLRDCFELNFVTRAWREVILPGNGIPREMLSAVCFGDAAGQNQRRATDVAHVVIYGGRDVAGQLTSDTIMLHHPLTTAAASSSAAVSHIDVTTQNESQATPVCCHTTVKLAPWVGLAIGGMTPFGSPPFDSLVAATKEGAVRFVPIPRLQMKADGSTGTAAPGVFGFGHCSCSWQQPDGSRRHIVVAGLTPDAASGPMELFELRILR